MPDSHVSLLAAATTNVDRDNAVAPAEPTERAEQFVAVSGPESEQVSASGMVVGAYGLFWLIVFAVVGQTYRSQAKLMLRIADIEKKLSKDERRP
jgi:hypothetical protein